jgi:hypothetical protein
MLKILLNLRRRMLCRRLRKNISSNTCVPEYALDHLNTVGLYCCVLFAFWLGFESVLACLWSFAYLPLRVSLPTFYPLLACVGVFADPRLSFECLLPALSLSLPAIESSLACVRFLIFVCLSISLSLPAFESSLSASSRRLLAFESSLACLWVFACLPLSLRLLAFASSLLCL